MFSWSYPHDNKIVLIQNMALTIEDSRDMVSAELQQLYPTWDKGNFDKMRHNVRSLNLTVMPGFQPRTVSIQIVDSQEKMMLTSEITRKAIKSPKTPRSTESPSEGRNGLRFFSFVYSDTQGVSYNISVLAVDMNAARKIVTDSIGLYENNTIKDIQPNNTPTIFTVGLITKFEYKKPMIALVTRVTNLVQSPSKKI